ncbi:MAG: hypothetical protein H0W61_06710 [Bacteroidetes bacterium]|nr:hypothetical protein [Bacteroidota bacterium]
MINDFELSLEEGNPVNIFSFIMDLHSIPPITSGQTLSVEKYIPLNALVKSVAFKDANFENGYLNIYSCRFENGKCVVYIFGNLKGQLLKTSIDFKIETLRDFDLLNEKINFILSKSKNILKSYYKAGKLKNIEHHLLAFLSDRQTG